MRTGPGAACATTGWETEVDFFEKAFSVTYLLAIERGPAGGAPATGALDTASPASHKGQADPLQAVSAALLTLGQAELPLAVARELPEQQKPQILAPSSTWPARTPRLSCASHGLRALLGCCQQLAGSDLHQLQQIPARHTQAPACRPALPWPLDCRRSSAPAQLVSIERNWRGCFTAILPSSPVETCSGTPCLQSPSQP